jgi:hypothetical protein
VTGADLEAARRELTRRVMGRPGVVGTAVGERRGEPCLKVYVEDDRAARTLPAECGGFPVVAETTGGFRPL